MLLRPPLDYKECQILVAAVRPGKLYTEPAAPAGRHRTYHLPRIVLHIYVSAIVSNPKQASASCETDSRKYLVRLWVVGGRGKNNETEGRPFQYNQTLQDEKCWPVCWPVKRQQKVKLPPWTLPAGRLRRFHFSSSRLEENSNFCSFWDLSFPI